MNKGQNIEFGHQDIHWQDIVQIAKNKATLSLSSERMKNLHNARKIVDKVIHSGERAYGISTGLGALCNVNISKDEQNLLSQRILLSHACGVGDALSIIQTRAIMACAVANFSQGHSGISPKIVELLLDVTLY